ncbi:Sodium/metabolite cotransporter like [Actinidia chinensis var. chinensis]|uniref:Probable sodium/metabolite cotransporter BASS4, chloroplastic n=1 Tax=Actinidia chinensis var. chinensis TaxID=1590841 RepID=A0A2R6PX20_ACTCC|nr:Sodium/metabolite cotransporter like [Actinidia chinensis var. chinensis]
MASWNFWASMTSNFLSAIMIFGSILLFTPFFSRLILQLQLQPQEFVTVFLLSTGLAIFSCMPTTLSSGVALTRLAGGNSALALAMTVISNLLGILIVPFSISMFIANGVGVTVPTKQLLRSLVLTLLVPLIIGKVCRESSKGLAVFVDQNRKLLSMISALLLGLVPWIQVSRSSSLLLMVKPAIFLVAVGMGALLHLILLAFNALAIQGLSAVSGGSKSVFAKRENVTALLLVASQKTLPVMAAVVEQLGGALGESGLLILPCVAAHLNQIIMDSFFVNFWLQNEQSSNQAKVA